MLHKETVEAGTLALLKKLNDDKELAIFNLAGGTALSLQLGHRKSIDIDLFTDSDFDAIRLAGHLCKNHKMEGIETSKNGISCRIENVKVTLIAHQYPLVNKIIKIEGVGMYSLEDIAAMKLNAIVYNGTRIKDFVDMHKLLEHLPLQKMTDAFMKKYPDVSEEMAHNGLKYHVDINKKEKIDYIGKEIPFAKVAERLKQSVNEPTKIFKTDLKIEQQEKPRLIEKKSRGKRNGLKP